MKLLILIRGLPGSGKSTLANLLIDGLFRSFGDTTGSFVRHF